MKGYYRNKEATDEVLKDGWLFTGDLGYIDPDGFLVVIGREKALLISEDGEKFSPEEIEEAIVNSSPVIAQVMVYNDHNKFTSALITVDREKLQRLVTEKNLSTEEDILALLKEQFYRVRMTPEYQGRFPEKWIPSTFQLIDEPFSEKNQFINSTMKMVRYRITGHYKERIDYMYTSRGKAVVNEQNKEAVRKILSLN
jgi:long-chain acyl-CoA synthetase